MARPVRLMPGLAAALCGAAVPALAADATPSAPPLPSLANPAPPANLSERRLLSLGRPLTPEEQARLAWIRNHPRRPPSDDVRRSPARPAPAASAPASPPPPPEDYKPKPVADGDPRMCEVEYNPKRVLKVQGAVGDTVALRFGEGEEMGGAFFSDTVSIQRRAVANMVFIKAVTPMVDRPFHIRMTTREGGQHLYVVEWTTGDRECYSIEFRYAAEDAARRRADRARLAQASSPRAAEQALAPGAVAPPSTSPPLAGPPLGANTNYGLRGEAGLLPQVQGGRP